MKESIAAFITIFILVFAAIYILKKSFYVYEQEKQYYEKYLDSSYVLNGDTLKIIDYSLLKESYKLSNGIEVSAKIIQKGKDR